MVKQIPNLITLSNLLLGCIAVVAIFNNGLYIVPYLLLGAALADFTDGFAARLLKANSVLGLQLDSLADMVSFGLVPGLCMYKLLELTLADFSPFMGYPAFLITLGAAYRLAKFNIDIRQTSEFLGLATPAVAMFVVSLVLIHQHNYFDLSSYIITPGFLYAFVFILCVLMNVELPMFSLKVKKGGWQKNGLIILSVFSIIILLLLFKGLGLGLVVVLYILVSGIKFFIPMKGQQ